MSIIWEGEKLSSKGGYFGLLECSYSKKHLFSTFICGVYTQKYLETANWDTQQDLYGTQKIPSSWPTKRRLRGSSFMFLASRWINCCILRFLWFSATFQCWVSIQSTVTSCTWLLSMVSNVALFARPPVWPVWLRWASAALLKESFQKAI